MERIKFLKTGCQDGDNEIDQKRTLLLEDTVIQIQVDLTRFWELMKVLEDESRELCSRRRSSYQCDENKDKPTVHSVRS